MRKVAIGMQVAFNKLADATWFDVLDIRGFNLVIREYDGHGTNYATQIIDKSLVVQMRKGNTEV